MKLPDFKKLTGKRVCVALSGGVDSVCLLHMLLAEREALSMTVSALTCEHGIRGGEALRDLRFVRSLCARWGVPLTEFAADVPTRAAHSGRGIEEEGRLFRYECFQKVLDGGEADLVATAHHADDLAETVLFRLARGTSLAGIAAVKEENGIVRPLLSLTKEELLRYASEHGLGYVEDSTNGDVRYSRNAVRKNVLPALEEVVTGAARHVAAFARRAGEDDAYLRELASEHIVREESGIRVPVTLPRPLLFRAMVMALDGLGCGRDYTEPLLQEIEKLTRLQSGRRVCFGGAEVIREGEELLFCVPRSPCTEEFVFGEGSFPFGETLAVVGRTKTEGALYADAAAFGEGCVVRTKREGDYFTPFGGGGKSLKKYLTDRKIPARRAKELPLVARGREVLVVFGVEIADSVKVTKDTQETLFFQIRTK